MTAGGGAPYKGSVPKDLAALLVEDGAVSAEVVERALARQRDAGGALDTALLELGAIDEERLLGYLARVSELPLAPPGAWTRMDARARRVFPSRVAERHGLAPFALDGRELSLVVTHPLDLGLLDEISFMLSLHLAAHVGPEWRVRDLIHRLYGGQPSPRLAALASGRPPVPSLAPVAGPAAEAPPPSTSARAAPRSGALARDLGGLEAAAHAEADFGSGEPSQEPPVLPAVFDTGGEGDALAAALAQAVEAVELGFLDDEAVAPAAEPRGPGELGDEPPSSARSASRSVAHAREESTPAPGSIDRSAPPHWTLEQARAALDATGHRDEVVAVALRYVRDFFEFAALFAVARDAVAGHDALGVEEGARELARSVALYASDPGVLRTVMDTGGQYLGPVTREPGTDAILRGLDRGTPRTVLVYPVLVRGRTVCLVYADNGEAPVSPRRLGELLTLLSGVGAAFERVLREGKQRTAAAPAAPEAWRTREPARLPTPDPDLIGAPESAPAEPPIRAVPPPAPALVAPVSSDPAEPPPDERYEAPAAEAGATPELEPAQPGEGVPDEPPPRLPLSPEEVARATAEALAAAGALEAVEPADVDVTFDEEQPEITDRVHLPQPEEPLGAIADRVFDPDPAVAAAAIEALGARRREPGLREATDRLRRALLSGLSARTVSAANALSAVRDVDAVPLMVQVLEKADPAAAQAVAKALRTITLQPLGKDPVRWLTWWKENRGRGRAEWLFGALTHPLRDIRAAAAAELALTAPPPVPYDPDWDLQRLQQATSSWAAWWAKSGLVI